ncbi:class I SAM-dependent methyltransferase [Maribacter aestuarii]|uniref:class I SAM-dependent methyltransferase n=1 Tax=Maribacter aestuarii TaxID=1130723 RepID=UPI00248BB700|nr:class I SAM-dependent methyltransferase [Maribacter aestuarii]
MGRYISCFLLLLLISIQPVCAQYDRADWNDRDKWMHLDELFGAVDLSAGDVVADIGCHEGYLTFHLSKRVGDRGKVYAVDVRRNRLERLNESLGNNKISNVRTILGDYDNPKLPNNTLDVVFLIDTYHEIDDYEQMLLHIKSALKPGGKLLILEKLKEQHIGKSRAAQAMGHTLSISYVEKELKNAGFEIESRNSSFGTWNREPEKQMWVLTATVNPSD